MPDETTQEELVKKSAWDDLLKRETEESLKGSPTEKKRRAGTRAKKTRKGWKKEGVVEVSQLKDLERRYPESRKEPPRDLPAIDVVGQETRRMSQSPEKSIVDKKGK